MAGKIKVIQVMGSLGMGGAESRMMDVFRNIDQSRYEFVFLSMDDTNEYYEAEIRELGGSIYRISKPNFMHLLSHLKQLRVAIRESGCDVVHAHTSFHCGLVMLAAKMEHVPIRISHARTTGSVRKSRLKNAALIVGRRLISRFSTDRLAISQDAGRFLFGQSDFEVLPNAINLDLYQQKMQNDKVNIRNDLRLPEGAVIIGQIGRFNSMKNHLFSLKWFSEYVKQYPNTRLVFVGDGSLRGDIEEQISQLGLAEKVILLGLRGDVPRIIHAFDVILFPSKYEGLGGVTLEAQAAGIPIVQSENLPIETDMGLGLIKRCSLEAPLSEWTAAVNECLYIQPMDYETIRKAFDRRKYSLDSEIKRLCEIYSGRKA